MIERDKVKTYECDKTSLMRRHNSNHHLQDWNQSDLANNFLLKSSDASGAYSNDASENEDDDPNQSTPKLYSGETIQASTLDTFAGPIVVGNSLFTRYRRSLPQRQMYIFWVLLTKVI